MHLQMIRPAATLLFVMTVLLGFVYPAVVTGVARVLFPGQAAGSLVQRDGQLVGSALIGQSFAEPRYFWGRPSATAPQPYNALASGGSNLGPLNPALIGAVRANAKALHEADPEQRAALPADLVMASASGLDPEISIAAARYQIRRVAKARHLPIGTVEALVASHRIDRLLGFIGEPRVNVLSLNMALDMQK